MSERLIEKIDRLGAEAGIKEITPEIRRFALLVRQDTVTQWLPTAGEEHMTHTINSTQTAAVATDYYWIPIDKDTPHGVKLQLLGQGGVAQYSSYHGDPFWSHWAPLPKRRD